MYFPAAFFILLKLTEFCFIMIRVIKGFTSFLLLLKIPNKMICYMKKKNYYCNIFLIWEIYSFSFLRNLIFKVILKASFVFDCIILSFSKLASASPEETVQ